MEVGFLGLGIMGTAMARNLIKHGFKVTVWNRTLSKCDDLVKQGATVGETPAAVVKKCKLTIAMLSDPKAALSVVFDKNGVIEEICEGKGYVDMSTVDADTSKKISEAVHSKGGLFVEAPVSGSKQPAEAGQLIILAAGDESLHKEAIRAFDAMGKKTFFLGEVGNGAKMKLVVNMLLGRYATSLHLPHVAPFDWALNSIMNSFSEGLVLAERSGLNPHDLLSILDLGAISTPMFRLKGPAMLSGNHPPAFPLKHQQKDLRLAVALGDDVALSLPVAAATNEVIFSNPFGKRAHFQFGSFKVYKKAISMGFGEEDFSAVYEVLKMCKE